MEYCIQPLFKHVIQPLFKHVIQPLLYSPQTKFAGGIIKGLNNILYWLGVIAHGPAPFLNIITLLSIQTLNDDKLNNYHDDVTKVPIFQAAI